MVTKPHSIEAFLSDLSWSQLLLPSVMHLKVCLCRVSWLTEQGQGAEGRFPCTQPRACLVSQSPVGTQEKLNCLKRKKNETSFFVFIDFPLGAVAQLTSPTECLVDFIHTRTIQDLRLRPQSTVVSALNAKNDFC